MPVIPVIIAMCWAFIVVLLDDFLDLTLKKTFCIYIVGATIFAYAWFLLTNN